MDVTPEAVERMLLDTGARCMIHGHTHRPAVHRLDCAGEGATRIVLGDWYEQGQRTGLERGGISKRTTR